MRKINEIFLNVQSFLMPSLQGYLDSFKHLQNILLQFHENLSAVHGITKKSGSNIHG